MFLDVTMLFNMTCNTIEGFQGAEVALSAVVLRDVSATQTIH